MFVLNRSVVLLRKIVTAFSQHGLEADQEICLHLLECFSEYQLQLDLQIQKNITK